MERLMKLWPLILVIAVMLLLGFSKDEPVPAFETWTGSVEVTNAILTYIDSNGDMVPHPNETWLVNGDVTQFEGQPATGNFYCWGTFLNEEMGSPAGATAYILRIQIDGQGTLMLSGAEMSSEPMVVLGGTGKFFGATGSYTEPEPSDGADIDGDGEPELDSAPQGLDLDGDGDNDGSGRIVFTFNILLPITGMS